LGKDMMELIRMNGNVTDDTLALIKESLANGETLAKTITTASGLLAYDLQPSAKNLYPAATPIRNALPRVGGGTGTATNWRQVNAIIGSGWDAIGWVPEGQRSGKMSYSTSTRSASFATIGEEDSVTFEAVSAAQGFEDVQATATMRLLQKMMLKEENALLGGNGSLQLGTAPTPTLSASGSGATLPAATYSVIAVALTYEGYRNSSVSGGIATTKSVTGADGASFAVNGGASAPSANATQAVTLGQTLFASVTPVTGAVGYAWFVGAVGSEKLQAITTISSAAFAAPLANSTQAASAIAADYSANPGLAFDGLLTSALKAGSGAYVNYLATGTAGTGTPLSASGRGSVNEIDLMLQKMWDLFEVSPTVLYVNSQEQRNITSKVLSSASAPLLRFNTDGKDPFAIVANGVVEYYYNPFALDGGYKIPVKIHPFVPPGTIIGWSENLPAQYQSSNVPNVAEVKTRRDYYRMDWPLKTRSYEFGVYAEEVLAVYAPFAMGVIGNIANG
jgi:hypothetical protein